MLYERIVSLPIHSVVTRQRSLKKRGPLVLMLMVTSMSIMIRFLGNSSYVSTFFPNGPTLLSMSQLSIYREVS